MFWIIVWIWLSSCFWNNRYWSCLALEDSELSKNIYASTTYWYDDDNFIYSIDYQGIYIYNATTRETKTIVSGTDKFEVTNFDYVNKILTYDGKDIKIEL